VNLAYNHHFLAFANAARVKEGRPESGLFRLAEKMLRTKLVTFPLFLFEWVFGFLLALPIPLYSTLVYMFITSMPGLPHFSGMYIRSLYYRRKLQHMESNVFIDQNVFFAYPKATRLHEFSYIDKYVTLMANNVSVGRRVHIAPRVIITGGGDFEIEDYACIATGTNVVTSTEVLKDGARCSGPMVDPEQRQVMRGKVLIKKDAFVGANVTLLPNVTLEQGSVAGANVTIARSTDPWGIYVGTRAKMIAEREPVKWPDN
jgi:acetyltransferase-like isoleucine patch superfamily enzyme